jgi:thiamine monophosphate kinase
VPLTRIGALTEGVGCRLLDADGAEILLEQHGYDHFA